MRSRGTRTCGAKRRREARRRVRTDVSKRETEPALESWRDRPEDRPERVRRVRWEKGPFRAPNVSANVGPSKRCEALA